MLESLTPYLLSLSGREARQRMAQRVALGEFALLATLDDVGGASQRLLAERLRKDPADIVRLVDVAERRGLVRRDADPEDRRRRRVSLTPAGEVALAEAIDAARTVEGELLAPLDDAERRTLHELLERLPR